MRQRLQKEVKPGPVFSVMRGSLICLLFLLGQAAHSSETEAKPFQIETAGDLYTACKNVGMKNGLCDGWFQGFLSANEWNQMTLSVKQKESLKDIELQKAFRSAFPSRLDWCVEGVPYARLRAGFVQQYDSNDETIAVAQVVAQFLSDAYACRISE